MDWIIRNGKGARMKLAYNSECSISLINKLVRENSDYVPRQETRLRICRATSLSEDALFPPIACTEQNAPNTQKAQ